MDRVVRSGCFVLLCGARSGLLVVFVLVLAVCGGVSSGGGDGGAKVHERVVGVAALVSFVGCVICGGFTRAGLALSVGVFAGRQVGGVGQLRQDRARLGRGHGEGGAEAGGALCFRLFGGVLTGRRRCARARQLRA